MVSPDDKGKESEDKSGENERLVTPERLAGVIGNNFRHDAHARQNQDVHFRVAEKPK